MIPVVIQCPARTRRDGLQFFDRAPIDDPAETHDLDPLFVEVDPEPVCVVPADALLSLLERRGRFTGYEKRFGSVPDRDRAILLALFNLIEATRTGQAQYENEYLGFLEAARRRAPARDKVNVLDVLPLRASELKDNAEKKKMLSTAFRAVGLATTLTVWWNETTKTLEPGLHAGESFSDALFALLFLSLQNSVGSARCARCRKPYTRTKTTQIFCSAKCSANERKARQRSREKESLSHGTHKTR